jgi:hypothetical protein
MLKVPTVILDVEGPGFRLISPERMMSKVTTELKWILRGADSNRRGLRKKWTGM